MTSSFPLKNVVVVGAASSGILTAQSIAKTLPPTHRVVLIEANPCAYWSIAALRAAVLPGYEGKVVHDLTGETVFGPSTRHIVLNGTKVVDLGSDYVVVDRDVTGLVPGSTVEGDRGRIEVDRAVLAIGADYGFPARISTEAKSKEDVLEDFKKMQRDIEAATEILVVGGGPTGVEFAGEVLDVHPGKKITLISRSTGLGSSAFTGLSSKLIHQLKARGVRLILNDFINTYSLRNGPLDSVQTFTTSTGESISADYVLLTSGGKPNTKWLQSLDSSMINSDGLIKVSPTFNILAPGWDRFFAVGDAASTPGPKTSFMASQHAPLAAHNVVASIKGETESKWKKAGGPPGNVLLVPVGTSGGASQLFFLSVGSWMTSLIKGKTLFLSTFEGWFKA